MKVAILHVHAQLAWHDDAVLVGNEEGLRALREAITEALESGEGGHANVTAADGEGYQVVVKLRSADFGARAWDDARLPYTDEVARERDPQRDY